MVFTCGENGFPRFIRRDYHTRENKSNNREESVNNSWMNLTKIGTGYQPKP